MPEIISLSAEPRPLYGPRGLPFLGRIDQCVANGGRVLNVTARGATIAEAQARAYAAVDAIDWPDGFCRRDIGTA